MHAPLLSRLAAAGLLAGLLALTAAPADAAVPTGNLLVNPGAEAGAGASDSAQTLPPPGWTVDPGFTAVQYGTPDFLTLADSTALGGGQNFFAGGSGADVSTATQLVDVSGAAPEIDAGTASVTVAALLGGYSSQTDYATVDAAPLDASGASLGSTTLPPVTPAERSDVTTLLRRSAALALPAGTRAVRVRIAATRLDGSYNDGYADNVSLSFNGPDSVPVFHQTVIVRVVSGKVLVRKPGSKTFVALDATKGIPLGSTVDARHGVVELTSVPKAGGQPQTAKFYDGIFTVTQPGSVTQLALSEPLAACTAGRAAAAKSKPKTRKLWGDGKGSFATKGRYSSATVRGTKWLVQDSCAGTLTRVARGVVAVRDTVRNKTILVRAGKTYLAKPKR